MDNMKIFFGFLIYLIFLFLITKEVEAHETFVVKIGQNKIFSAFNLNTTLGTATSDGKNASATVQVGPYQSGKSEAKAGVKFYVDTGPNNEQIASATISITLSYKLKVELDVMPPEQGGGGSVDARVYAWILNYKKELGPPMHFIHYSNNSEIPTTETTFVHKTTESPIWTHLHAGKYYEICADIYTHAQVYKGYFALSYAEVTVEKIEIKFDCDFVTEDNDPREQCFGGIGRKCNGIAPRVPFVKDYNTCMVKGYASVGSILHDNCCLATKNEGYGCKGALTGNPQQCADEWALAKYDFICGRFWPRLWGPYLEPNNGDILIYDVILSIPDGAKVPVNYAHFCKSEFCSSPRQDACGYYCICGFSPPNLAPIIDLLLD